MLRQSLLLATHLFAATPFAAVANNAPPATGWFDKAVPPACCIDSWERRTPWIREITDLECRLLGWADPVSASHPACSGDKVPLPPPQNN